MDPKLMDKLQKVLALAKQGIEGEAQAASLILQKMLTEHNLSMADLEQKGAAPQGVTEGGHDLGKAAFRWKLDLAEAIAGHYWCVPLVDRRAKTVTFVGRPDNIESLRMLYAWLIGQIKIIAREDRARHQQETGEHVDPLRWQVNFGIGAVSRLGERLKQERRRHEEEMARNDMGDVVALTCTRASENSDYLEKQYGYRVDGEKTAEQKEREERSRKFWAEYEQQQKEKEEAERAADPEGYDAKKAAEAAQREEENRKYWEQQRKREERNARRRKGRVGREPTAEELRKEDQAWQARKAGRDAAHRINLQPFIEGKVPDDDQKRIG